MLARLLSNCLPQMIPKGWDYRCEPACMAPDSFVFSFLIAAMLIVVQSVFVCVCVCVFNITLVILMCNHERKAWILGLNFSSR